MSPPLAPLVRLRWVAVALQVGLVVMGTTLPGESVPTAAAVGLVLVGAGSNAALQRISRDVPLGGRWTVSVLAFDLCLLTGLLAVAQGTSNPFTALYMVVVAIAASVLSEWATASAAAPNPPGSV